LFLNDYFVSGTGSAVFREAARIKITPRRNNNNRATMDLDGEELFPLNFRPDGYQNNNSIARITIKIS